MRFSIISIVFLFASHLALSQVKVPYFGEIKYLKGYAKEIAGENINYTSAIPDVAKTALLTRCTTGEMSIAWETQPIPAENKEPYVYFAMLAAYSQGTIHGDRSFNFFINDKKFFTIKTFKNKKDSLWHYEAPSGEALVFVKTREDANYDYHGYLYLRLPTSGYMAGEPVKITIVGEKENSPDWLMVFKYDLKEDVSILPLSLITKDNKQPITIRVVHFGENKPIEVTLNKETYSFNLISGKNEFQILQNPVKENQKLTISTKIKDILDTTFSIVLKPVIHRNIYFIHHSHYDLGYSDLQANVEIRHNQNIINALRYIDRTKNYPDDARFRWNIETANAVDNFKKVCTPEQWNKLIQNIKDGYITIGMNYANISTGICSPDELFKITYFSNKLIKENGIKLETAMMGDIPGLVWSSLPAMARTGVKYFSDGPNYGGAPMYEGDRIGWSSVSWKDQPFYWVSPSGEEKILFWLAGKGYSSWHGTKSGDIFSIARKRISDYMNELQESNYPYNIVQWRYNIVADNGPADSLISDFVKKWNEDYLSPKIILSTVDNMFQVFEAKYGDKLPKFSGDFTPYWEDGCYSTASEMIMNNRNSAALTNLANLYSIRNPKEYSQTKFDEAWTNLLLFDEHTWGAYNSISDPDLPFVTEQWKYKREYALRADSLIKVLGKTVFDQEGYEKQVDVYNTASWERSGIVYLKPSQCINVNSITDVNGKEMMLQKLSDGSIAFLAESVPSFGGKRFLLSSTKSKLKQTTSTNTNIGTYSNKYFQISFDPKNGSISSLKLLPENIELVDNKTYSGLNEYLYVAGLDPDKAVTNTEAVIRIKERGPLFTTYAIDSKAAGCNAYYSEITVYENESRIDISNTMDKIPTRDKESVHVAFPFLLPEAENRFNTGWNGIFSPSKNQLKGANQDYYCVQNWLDISNSKTGVTMLLLDANLIEQGSMLSEVKGNFGVKDWKKTPTLGSTVFSYVLNNYWHTNFKVDQGGKINVRYSLLPHKVFNMLETQRAGIGYSSPLLVVPANNNPLPLSLFRLSDANIIATSIEPDGNKYKIRMYNVSDKNISCKILWDGVKPEKMKIIYNADDAKIVNASEAIEFPALGIIEIETE